MTKKDALQHVTITALSHEGRGVAHDESGKTVFIENALVGEHVGYKLKHRKSHYSQGIAEHITQPSPNRVQPLCPHVNLCGGCSLQHMDPTLQRKIKQAALSEMLQHQANVVVSQWLPPLIADHWGYRRKARLSVKFVEKKNKVLVGFREKAGRYVANLSRCDILHNTVGQQIDALSAMLMQLSIKAFIPQLEVVIGDNITALIIRHLSEFQPQDLDILRTFAKDKQMTLYLQPAGIDSIHPFYPETPEELCYTLTKQNIKIAFQPHQFTQINHSINLKMITQALTLLELQPNDRVIDLFCGVGNFSLPMAQHCQSVVGIEGDTTAVQQATINAESNDINNCAFHYDNLFAANESASWCQTGYDKVVLDPPRAGAKEIIPLILQWRPQRILYVSCSPATLARDSDLLVRGGYKLATAGIMDMFPHTKHVEAMALFILK